MPGYRRSLPAGLTAEDMLDAIEKAVVDHIAEQMCLDEFGIRKLLDASSTVHATYQSRIENSIQHHIKVLGYDPAAFGR